MQKVRCKKCRAEVILTSDDKEELKKWEDKGEICSRCHKTKELKLLIKRKQTKKRKQAEKRMREIQEEVKELKIEAEKEALLKEKFERLLELREQYFELMYGKERNKGVVDEIEKFFDVHLFEVFDHYEREFAEFFHMGENGDAALTWKDLLNLIKEYKKNLGD